MQLSPGACGPLTLCTPSSWPCSGLRPRCALRTRPPYVPTLNWVGGHLASPRLRLPRLPSAAGSCCFAFMTERFNKRYRINTGGGVTVTPPPPPARPWAPPRPAPLSPHSLPPAGPRPRPRLGCTAHSGCKGGAAGSLPLARGRQSAHTSDVPPVSLSSRSVLGAASGGGGGRKRAHRWLFCGSAGACCLGPEAAPGPSSCGSPALGVCDGAVPPPCLSGVWGQLLTSAVLENGLFAGRGEGGPGLGNSPLALHGDSTHRLP